MNARLKRFVFARGKMKVVDMFSKKFRSLIWRKSIQAMVGLLVIIFFHSCLSLFLIISLIVLHLLVYPYFSERLQNLSIWARYFSS